MQPNSPRYTPDISLKSRTSSGSSSGDSNETASCSSTSGDEKMSDEFPYGRAFKAAMGRVTTFPDGTEAVMIDSALALEAFQLEQMVMCSYYMNYLALMNVLDCMCAVL